MKSKIAYLVAALMLLPLCSFGHQPEGQRNHKEQWMAQKIAYLTEVMDLTTEEAQVFWPIYNQAQKEKREAYKAVKQAYANLDKGIQEAAARGYIAGYPVVDFRVKLYDGSYHPVDSSEMAFKVKSFSFKSFLV